MQNAPQKINTAKMKNQAGLTLLELSLALGLALAIAAIAIGFYTTTSGTRASADMQTQLLGLTSAARQTGVNGDYFGVDSSVLARARKVPAAWIGTPADPALAIKSAVGGVYIITPRTWNGTVSAACTAAPCNAFQIEATAVPADACNTVVNSSAANFVNITVGATPVKSTTVPMTSANLATACDNATNIATFTVVG